MEKSYSAPAKEVLEIQSGSQFSKRIVFIILLFLKKYFKSEILIELPQGLQNFDLEMIRLIKLASQAQTFWDFEIKRLNYSKKEPFIFCYQASMGGNFLSINGDFFDEKRVFEKTILEAISMTLTNQNNSISIGRNFKEATVNKIWEIISQSAFRRAVNKKMSLRSINLQHLIGQDDRITKIIKRFEIYDLGLSIFLLPSEFSTYSILSIISVKKDGDSGTKTTFSGLNSSFDLKTAIINSVSRAMSKRIARKNGHFESVEPITIKEADKLTAGSDININLFENQNFFNMPESADTTREECYEKILQLLNSELKNKNFGIDVSEFMSKKLSQLGLCGVKVRLQKHI
jgi:hypothetical protein